MVVNYLGITFQVVHEDTTSVTLHRTDIESHDGDFTVMKDSPRYEAMFRKPKLSFASLVKEAKKEIEPIKKAPDPLIYNFLDRYAVDSTTYESADEELEALHQDIHNDTTGLLRFIATTFAYRANKVFNGSNYADTLIDNIPKTPHLISYTPKLLEAYLDALDSPSESRIKAVAELIPNEHKDEILKAILGFDFGVSASWLVSPKQVQSLLNSGL